MAKKRKGKKAPELRVVLDTNVLFTGAAHYLVSRDVEDLIKRMAEHPDLQTRWYLPDVVVAERRYQMRQHGMAILPWIAKLERLLGHGLAVTPEIVSERIDATIEEQLQRHQIERLGLRLDDVDWTEMIRRATDRLAPFEAGEREKGFRDALICEAFCQLVDESPVTPSTCRITLVTGDKRLREAAEERVGSHRNVRILASLTELEGLVNTLVAAVGEEFVAQHRLKAADYFFGQQDEECLFYREKIGVRIRSEFASELTALPEGASERDNGTWFIHQPEFVRKEKRRVFWVSRIAVEAEAFRRILETLSDIEGKVGGEWPVGATVASITQLVGLKLAQAASGGESQKDVLSFSAGRRSSIAKGRSLFDVNWSVSIADDGVFRAARVESVDFVETVWDESV